MAKAPGGLDGMIDPIKSVMKQGQPIKSIKIKSGDSKVKVKFAKNEAIKRAKSK